MLFVGELVLGACEKLTTLGIEHNHMDILPLDLVPSPTHMSILPCIHVYALPIYMSVHCLHTCLYTAYIHCLCNMSIHCLYMIMHLFMHMSAHKSVRMSIRMSVHMSIHMSIHMSMYKACLTGCL